MRGQSVLVVEDDPELRELLSRIIGGDGYEILEAVDGQAGLSAAFTLHPDLVLLDRSLPQLDGIEVLRRLRSHFVTSHVPVILVSGKSDMDDRLLGLEAGADDYIVKPFHKRELLARVASVIRRSQRSLAADPLTKLPGNLVLREELRRRLAAGSAGATAETGKIGTDGEDAVGAEPEVRPERKAPEGLAVGYVDVDHFKPYVDGYGFEAAARVIQRAAQALYAAVTEHGDPEDFVGHIGGDDFLILTSPRTAPAVAKAVVEGFDRFVPEFYREPDRSRGYVEGRDRYGTPRRFPLVSVSVAVVEVPPGATPDPAELAEFAAGCKNELKRDRGEGWRRFPFHKDGGKDENGATDETPPPT